MNRGIWVLLMAGWLVAGCGHKSGPNAPYGPGRLLVKVPTRVKGDARVRLEHLVELQRAWLEAAVKFPVPWTTVSFEDPPLSCPGNPWGAG